MLHDFTTPDLRLALDLLATSPELGARDAVHAATALRWGIPAVVSPDRAFGASPAWSASIRSTLRRGSPLRSHGDPGRSMISIGHLPPVIDAHAPR